MKTNQILKKLAFTAPAVAFAMVTSAEATTHWRQLGATECVSGSGSNVGYQTTGIIGSFSDSAHGEVLCGTRDDDEMSAPDVTHIEIWGRDGSTTDNPHAQLCTLQQDWWFAKCGGDLVDPSVGRPLQYTHADGTGTGNFKIALQTANCGGDVGTDPFRGWNCSYIWAGSPSMPCAPVGGFEGNWHYVWVTLPAHQTGSSDFSTLFGIRIDNAPCGNPI